MKLNEFAAENKIARSTAYYRAQKGALPTYTDSHGVMRIKNTPALAAQSLIKKTHKQNIKSIKEQLDNIILFESGDKPASVKKITEIVTYWEAQGIKIKGYNPKSIYRKITLQKVARKTRADKFCIRNQALNQSFNKVRELAVYLYKKNARGSLNDVVDLILEYAKVNEDYYEVASIPKGTLYRQLSLDFKQSGMQTVHDYLNHHNKYRAELPTATGAFTDGSLKFMQHIVGDDHKADVSSVYVYNSATKKVETKQVKIWAWDEMLTGKAWVYCKVGDITTEDLIRSLIPVILEIGLPTESIVVDNGIARSDDFKDFIYKLYQRKGIHFSPPYQPTAKAMKERAFGFYKCELDTYQDNFVSPHKEDSRHSGPQLSPEESTLLFEDYEKKLQSYITGRYLNRERTRVINNKKERISIGNFFDRCWQTYNPVKVTAQDIRFALSKVVIKEYNHGITMNNPALKINDSYIPSEPLPISFNFKSFAVLYNPYDTSEIDLYALEDIIDRHTGAYYEKDAYITTLYSMRTDNDKAKTISTLRKKINKNVKQIAEYKTALNELKAPMPDTITPGGDILKKREDIKKQSEIILKEKIDHLPSTPLHLTKEKGQGDEVESSLTWDEELK